MPNGLMDIIYLTTLLIQEVMEVILLTWGLNLLKVKSINPDQHNLYIPWGLLQQLINNEIYSRKKKLEHLSIHLHSHCADLAACLI